MSIRIDKITRGRFGNKILQYNSLIQLSKIHNVSCSFVQNNEITQFFKNVVPFIPSKKPIKLLTCKMILEDEDLDFENYEYSIDDPASCLHNVFYKVTKSDPRNFLELKEQYKIILPENIVNIGIHIRGGDIISNDGNNGREIHKVEYYKDSIEFVLKNYCKNKEYKFYICTDDTTFDTFLKTYNYLKENNICFQHSRQIGNANDYMIDWSLLSSCDILINSSSTFCLTSGFLEKKNKKIFHSKEWIDKNINHESWNDNTNGDVAGYTIIDFRKTFDNFWIDSINNNKYYNCYKII